LRLTWTLGKPAVLVVGMAGIGGTELERLVTFARARARLSLDSYASMR